jgi:hypothetical protein
VALQVVDTNTGTCLTGNIDHAKDRLSLLGRSGLPPWQPSESAFLLPYLQVVQDMPRMQVMLACPAHGYLRGPILTLLSFALKSTKHDLETHNVTVNGNTVVVSAEARRTISVCSTLIVAVDVVMLCELWCAPSALPFVAVAGVAQ